VLDVIVGRLESALWQYAALKHIKIESYGTDGWDGCFDALGPIAGQLDIWRGARGRHVEIELSGCYLGETVRFEVPGADCKGRRIIAKLCRSDRGETVREAAYKPEGSLLDVVEMFRSLVS
jgi:hypothetical protein